MYQYTSRLKNLFKKQEEVVQVKDFWEFMENGFLDGIYWEEWYNQGDEPNKFPCDPESKNVKGNLILALEDTSLMKVWLFRSMSNSFEGTTCYVL